MPIFSAVITIDHDPAMQGEVTCNYTITGHSPAEDAAMLANPEMKEHNMMTLCTAVLSMIIGQRAARAGTTIEQGLADYYDHLKKIATYYKGPGDDHLQ